MVGHYERYYNTCIGVSVKHRVLIHFGPHYHKGIAHDQKDGMKLRYPSQGTSKMLNG
jgi:hypothetical protein